LRELRWFAWTTWRIGRLQLLRMNRTIAISVPMATASASEKNTVTPATSSITP
jgi:hypothetical protein